MLAVVLLKAFTSPVEQREYALLSAVFRCLTLMFQLLLTRHPPKKFLLLPRRTSLTTLAYLDPRIPERPYCPLRGHGFPPRPQPPPTMLSDLHSLHLIPPGGHGQVYLILEVSVNSCQVFTNRSQHHLTPYLVKSLFPFLNVRLFFVYRISIRRSTCAGETRHRMYHPYPNPGPKRRWFRHSIDNPLRRRVMADAQNVRRPPMRSKLYRKRSSLSSRKKPSSTPKGMVPRFVSFFQAHWMYQQSEATP